MWKAALFVFAASSALAQPADPAYEPLQKAYDALRIRDYTAAIAQFEKAASFAPERAAIHKDLAYTLLKIGENDAARAHFAEAMRLDPQDHHVALEYAFLCYETKQRAEARRIFDRIRKTGDPASRATSEQAFQNIDRPLDEGIARWTEAIRLSPDNFSAHQELARLAEERDEPALAAEHYERAWRIRPGERSLLLDLGRVWKALGRVEDSNAALLAASRGAQPRVAERARELSPSRYPFVYEFRKAVDLDPPNLELHRELAYLLLAMGDRDEAEAEFRIIVASAPDDRLSAAQLGFLRLSRKDLAGAMPLLDRVLKGPDDELADRVRFALRLPQTLRKRPETPRDRTGSEAKILAEKSLQAGYLKDALKYLTIAHESDPVDFSVMLKLGWTYNILKQDTEAVKWFNLARKSPDPEIASEAKNAWNNLHPGLARFRTTAWILPFYSSRWKDMFSYAQVKTEMKLPGLPFRPYVSVRFVGDTRGDIGSGVAGVQPQYLSESSFILSAGVATNPWRGLLGWFEAGGAMKYLGQRTDTSAVLPDFRGGLSYAKGFGHLLRAGSHGFFAETNADGVYISRFQNDLLLYSQNRVGYTFAASETLGFQAQVYWNSNATFDSKGQYWANYLESGPGVRFRVAPLLFSINALRGGYLVQEGNPRGPVFYDIRIGVWYAFTH